MLCALGVAAALTIAYRTFDMLAPCVCCRSSSSLAFYGSMVIGKDAHSQSAKELAPVAQNSAIALDNALQLQEIRSGIRRQPGEHKLRSSSVMSFRGMTPFGCDGSEELLAPKPWWDHEAAAINLMWPESRKFKRKHKRNAQRSGGDAFKILSTGLQDSAKDVEADSSECPDSSLKCMVDLSEYHLACNSGVFVCSYCGRRAACVSARLDSLLPACPPAVPLLLDMLHRQSVNAEIFFPDHCVVHQKLTETAGTQRQCLSHGQKSRG